MLLTATYMVAFYHSLEGTPNSILSTSTNDIAPNDSETRIIGYALTVSIGNVVIDDNAIVGTSLDKDS